MQEGGTLPSGWPDISLSVPEAFHQSSFALSFMLVFRINSSYARWQEARTTWGSLINNCRDLCRLVRTAKPRCPAPSSPPPRPDVPRSPRRHRAPAPLPGSPPREALTLSRTLSLAGDLTTHFTSPHTSPHHTLHFTRASTQCLRARATSDPRWAAGLSPTPAAPSCTSGVRERPTRHHRRAGSRRGCHSREEKKGARACHAHVTATGGGQAPEWVSGCKPPVSSSSGSNLLSGGPFSDDLFSDTQGGRGPHSGDADRAQAL